jgi:hypothetical protein
MAAGRGGVTAGQVSGPWLFDTRELGVRFSLLDLTLYYIIIHIRTFA